MSPRLRSIIFRSGKATTIGIKRDVFSIAHSGSPGSRCLRGTGAVPLDIGSLAIGLHCPRGMVLFVSVQGAVQVPAPARVEDQETPGPGWSPLRPRGRSAAGSRALPAPHPPCGRPVPGLRTLRIRTAAHPAHDGTQDRHSSPAFCSVNWHRCLAATRDGSPAVAAWSPRAGQAMTPEGAKPLGPPAPARHD
jgi:hypothetical protein